MRNRLLLLGLLLLSGFSAAAQANPTGPLYPAGFVAGDALWHCHSCQWPVYRDGGFEGMQRAIAKNLRFPQTLRQDGRVFVQFTIDTTGQVRNVVVKQGLQPEADSVAVRAIGLLGRFSPALNPKGRPIATMLTVPVAFRFR